MGWTSARLQIKDKNMETLRPTEKQVSCICMYLMDERIEAGEGAIEWLEKELDRFTASAVIKALKEGKIADGVLQLAHLGLPLKREPSIINK